MVKLIVYRKSNMTGATRVGTATFPEHLSSPQVLVEFSIFSLPRSIL